MGVAARLLAAVLAGGAVMIVTGCGSSPAMQPAASKLLTSMQDSVRGAESVHISGRLTSNGVPVAVDLGVHRDGDMAGTISQNGAAFNVIGVDGKVFVQATPAFLREMGAPARACAVVCGKWVQLPPEQAGQLTGDLSMTSMTGLLASGHLPKFSAAGSSIVGGQSAWVLRANDGSMLDVSSRGVHYPLQAMTAGTSRDTLRYSQWNSVPSPSAPPAKQVLSLSGVP